MLEKFLKQKKVFVIIEVILLIAIIMGTVLLLFSNKKPKEDINDNQLQNKPEENSEINKNINIIDVNSKSRPIAVMINNASDARPYQKGLQNAYIVYEMINYADGSTRFMALFKDKDLKEIGPIRSARHYHLDYVLENDAIYVHWGYSPQAQSDLKTLGINNINGITYGNTYFWTAKIDGVNISHRRFTSTELLNKAINKLNYKSETNQKNLFKYNATSVDLEKNGNLKDATKVDIYYSSKNYSSYLYDNESGYYLRSVKGISHVDASTNEQLKVKNIITYQIKNTTIAGDDASRQELHNIGTGKGYYITEGKAIEINWKKDCRECQTKYTYENGEEVILNDGNTFIQIQPNGEKLSIS